MKNVRSLVYVLVAAALTTGEQRLTALIDRYGADVVRQAIAEMRHRAERQMRAKIAGIPDGIYEAESFMDHDGMVRTERFDFGDILHLDVWPGPVTVYAIRGRWRGVHFTSFFAHHRRLVALLVEKAGLAPLRS